ncbi:AP-4 complex subunit epsilon, putative [Plasmodium ovale curtisi]|uniref:AP-4 complex subunit epsilon, putative n=1 Tax=Plasmodium ovale curtisi TaxID=864141 RepID=A0A1A8VVQ8_PLAOA|nr:AP-4 complex subunit epsilon, putative [Plasmodium ovale curtisi]
MLGLGGSCLSKEFFDLAKSIGEARSKQEEDRIIFNEIILLKSRFADPNASVVILRKQIKEYLIRAIYIEMLGHDASFAYIHAVKLAHEKNILCKRTGYLSCNLFLHKDHELMLLLINTIQKDLKSDNHLEIWAALNCVCKLLNSEMIPAIFPIIKNLLNHKNELVRKKVCMLLHKMYLIDPSLIKDIDIYLKKLLCDVDPSVMGASLNLIFCIAKNDIMYCIKLVPYLVSILKQICENKLPKEYEYHRIPAPWIQIKILAIFRILGFSNKKLSEQMYEVLQKTMQRADFGINVGYAIIYECVKTIATIYPSHHLLELASLSISRFISSDNHNLKYVGVTGLALIVKINPMYASKHQLAVVDCLEDKDETLKMKTLDLLYQMTNPLNVQVIVDKLLFHVENSVDIHFKHDLACKIIQLIERYTPDDIWFLNKINSLFLSVGELLDESYSYSLIKLLKDSSTGLDSDSGDEIIKGEVNEEGTNTDMKKVQIECLNIADLDSGKDLLDVAAHDGREVVNSERISYKDTSIIDPFKGENINAREDNEHGHRNNTEIEFMREKNEESKEKCINSSDKRQNEPKNCRESVDENHVKRKKINDVCSLRKYAVNTYINMLENNENIPFILMQIICWVLGEYGYLCDIENYSTEDIIDLLCECVEKNFNNPDRVKSCLITAIFKLCCFNNITDHIVAKKLIEKYKNSRITDMQQRCYEYDLILNNPTLMKNIFSPSSKQKIIIDENLSFLDPYVEKHLQNGGKTYIAKDLRKNENKLEISKNNSPVLNFTPYELPINNKLHVDTFHTSNKNSQFEKKHKYDSPINVSDMDNFSNKEKEKTVKLHVVGPKKWKKETCKIEGREKNKKKKKKKKKKDREMQNACYNQFSDYLNTNENKLSKGEEQTKAHRIRQNRWENVQNFYAGEGNVEGDDDEEEEEDDDEEYEEEEDGESHPNKHRSVSDSGENEKRMDSLDDYYGQNYERFDDKGDSHSFKEHKYENENYNSSSFNKQGSSHLNSSITEENTVLTEKEKMAAALFNGLISNNSSLFNSKNSFSSNYSSKKSMSIFSNRNYFNSRYDDNNDKSSFKKNAQDGNRNYGKMKNDYGVIRNQDEEKKMSSSTLLDSNLNNSGKLEENKKPKFTFDMIDLNEPPTNEDHIEENNATREEDKSLWNSISNQKKAVFLNKSKFNIFQTIKKFESNLNSSAVEVSKKEALTSCVYNNNKVLIKIKIEDNKLIFLVKSAENSIIDSVFDILRNLFHL